jgi:hypothetical protein
MYSPKIDEFYIPILYRLAKRLRVPMTRLVNAMIASGIREIQTAKRHEHRKKKGRSYGQNEP